jgi:hypothetical protein
MVQALKYLRKNMGNSLFVNLMFVSLFIWFMCFFHQGIAKILCAKLLYKKIHFFITELVVKLKLNVLLLETIFLKEVTSSSVNWNFRMTRSKEQFNKHFI